MAASLRLSIDLVNVQLAPYDPSSSPTRQLRHLRHIVRRRADAANLVAGDINFVDLAEGRLNLSSGRQDFIDEPSTAEFASASWLRSWRRSTHECSTSAAPRW